MVSVSISSDGKVITRYNISNSSVHKQDGSVYKIHRISQGKESDEMDATYLGYIVHQDIDGLDSLVAKSLSKVHELQDN